MMAYRILVVDDQREICDLIQATFRLRDYTVTTATDGPSAMAAVRREKPDVIVLDVLFPTGPDGIEVCRQFKSDPATSNVRIVMLTSLMQESEYRQLAVDAGADACLAKPFSPLELIGVVDELLSRSAP